MPINTRRYGEIEGRPVAAFRIEDGQGLAAEVIEYGATLTRLVVPDRSGAGADIVLGFDRLEGYVATRTYFGATVGRYANRIADATFTLDGEVYELGRNNGRNHLHGGFRGFDKRLWRGEADAARNAVRLYHRSPDGDEGYPGTLDATVEYRFAGQGRLIIEMTAKTDRPTIVNLVNHSYFNLAGHASGTVLDQQMMFNADHYTPVNEELIPTGEIAPVSGTPFDFTSAKPIGRDLGRFEPRSGYDHNWILRGSGMRLCARVADPASGRGFELWTTEPGVQFYIGGQLDGSEFGKDGTAYRRHAGFTLETQRFPDSPNRPNFPSPILRPGEAYRHLMEFRFHT